MRIMFTTNLELWIEQDVKIEQSIGRSETLTYFTLEELLGLRNEINQVIKEIVGV